MFLSYEVVDKELKNFDLVEYFIYATTRDLLS